MTERLQITDVSIRRGGKFLVVTNRKHPEGYTCPGGKVDPGETPAEGAIRELEEEVGLKVSMKFLHINGYFAFRWRGQPIGCWSFELEAAGWEGQEPRAVEEGTKIMWVDRDDLLDVDGDCLSQAFYGWLMGKKGW